VYVAICRCGNAYIIRRTNRSQTLNSTQYSKHPAQRAKITEKVHKPPRNHYIEWPVFSDIGLNCESQGEKGRTCKKYKILIGSRVYFFHFIHDLPFSPGHLLESEKRFVNLFCNFNPLCPAAPPIAGEACRARRASLTNSKRFPRCIVVTTKKIQKKYTTQSLTEY
jgi:hypothetical protein